MTAKTHLSLLIFGCVVLQSPGCSSAPQQPVVPSVEDHVLSLPIDTRKVKIELLWKKTMLGLIGDLNLSQDGSTVLVATSPNRELVPGGASTPTVSAWSSENGKLRWKHTLPAPVKAQTISPDGRLAVASNYDGELAAWSETGRQQWKLGAMCEPHVMNVRVACYHDDDAEPSVAFRVYSATGGRLGEYPIEDDILAFAVSPDARNLALGLTGGQVVLISPEFGTSWKKKVSGEILSVATAPGPDPRVAVLTSSRSITLFDSQGTVVGTKSPSGRADQISFSPDGLALWSWGNTSAGQYLTRLSVPSLDEQWQLKEKRQADLVSTLGIVGSGENEIAVVGFEDIFRRPRGPAKHHHVLGVGADGKVRWNVAFAPEANIYLISTAQLSSGRWRVAIATDDGHLSVYQIES